MAASSEVQAFAQPTFNSLLNDLAMQNVDALVHLLSFLPPVDVAAARLLNRDISAAASDDSVWRPLLLDRGFLLPGLNAWAPRPAFVLYGRLHEREACELELLRRTKLQESWYAESTLDLLNPFDEPVWVRDSHGIKPHAIPL